MTRIEIPIRLESLANVSWHWSKKHKVRKQQKNIVGHFLNHENIPKEGPWDVILTRIGPRILDADNLVSSYKNITDSVAEHFHPGLAPGRADGLGDINFTYRQEKGKKYSLIIEIS